MTKSKARIFGYVRTSSAKQELSLEEQEERIAARAQEMDGDYKGCYQEQKSAVSVSWRDRDQFQALCREMETGDILIVWRLNRIDRHPWRMIGALDYLVERRIRVIALELEFGSQATKWELDLETTHGRMMVMLMALVAEWWLGSMREEVSAALQRLKAQGYSIGTAPGLGKRFERVYPNDPPTARPRKHPWRNKEVWDEEQCDYIREVWIRHRLFNENLQTVAQDFCRRHVTTAAGHPWVREYQEKDRGQEDAAPTLGLKRWRRDRLYAALKLVDDHMQAGTLPPELHIDEQAVRRVALRVCDTETYSKLVEAKNGT